MRFIIADRQTSTRSALRLLLEQYPEMLFTGEAGDFNGLVKLVEAKNADLALVEWELLGAWPKGSLADLKKLHPMKIIVLSCCLDRSLPLNAGADYYVSKGDKPEHLIGVLHDIRGYFASKSPAR